MFTFLQVEKYIIYFLHCYILNFHLYWDLYMALSISHFKEETQQTGRVSNILAMVAFQW